MLKLVSEQYQKWKEAEVGVGIPIIRKRAIQSEAAGRYTLKFEPELCR